MICSSNLHSQTVRAKELKFGEKVHLPPSVMWHMSHIPCQVSILPCGWHYQHWGCDRFWGFKLVVQRGRFKFFLSSYIKMYQSSLPIKIAIAAPSYIFSVIEWCQQIDINRVSSLKWHQQSDINREKFSNGQQQSEIKILCWFHFVDVILKISLCWCHFENLSLLMSLC